MNLITEITVKGYQVTLEWDESDKIYVAVVPALPGCAAHGTTQQEAIREIEVAIGLHLARRRQSIVT